MGEQINAYSAGKWLSVIAQRARQTDGWKRGQVQAYEVWQRGSADVRIGHAGPWNGIPCRCEKPMARRIYQRRAKRPEGRA